MAGSCQVVDRETCGPLDRRASGPPGFRAGRQALMGRRATGPPDHRTAQPRTPWADDPAWVGLVRFLAEEGYA